MSQNNAFQAQGTTSASIFNNEQLQQLILAGLAQLQASGTALPVAQVQASGTVPICYSSYSHS